MRLKMMCKRITALLTAVFLLITMCPMSILAESETEVPPMSSELPNVSTVQSYTPETTTTEEDLTNESETDTVELLPEETPAEEAEQPVEDAETGSSVESRDENDASEEPTGEEVSDPTVTDPADASATEADQAVDSTPAPVDQLQAPSLRSAASPSRFTGDEAVRLGKESSNINGIITQKDGSSSTSIARHWVTVDGVEYTAFCIEASDASTSGRDGGLEPGTDAGLLWILNNVPDDSDEDYAIKQQAIWAYLGQSFSISNLAAGSRCSLSTDQLRERLNEIVSNAQSASLTGSQELWIAYHLDNRDYYQDMAFTVAEPPPSVTPTPEPTSTPVPTPEPIFGSIQVMKLDTGTGEPLAGAYFQLYDEFGVPVGDSVMTNDTGIAAWSDLPCGNYFVQETVAPAGYVLDATQHAVSITENNQLLTVEAENRMIVGKIRIIKLDADTKSVLPGATFSVADAAGNIVYRVEETGVPEHYVDNGFSVEAVINEEDMCTYLVDCENEPTKGWIQLVKVDAFIVATHIDKHHIHNHIIWNATTLDCQRKFRNFFMSYKAVARLSDLICTEHHLSVVLDPKHTGIAYGAWLGSHKQISHREALMMAIDAALAQKPQDFEALLKLLKDAGIEIKSGKQLSLRMLGTPRFVRLNTIGEQYTEESLRAIIKGQKAHKAHTRRAPSIQLDRIQLMIDIAAKTKEGKGEGYARWAKKYNLKQLARSVVYLTELGISSETQMSSRLNAATKRHDDLRGEIRSMDDRMNEISELQRHIFNYKKYRKFYTQYKESGYDKRFADDHQQELALFKAARQAFDAAGITKLPKIEDLRTEFAELKDQKQIKLAEYRTVRDELNNLRKAKGNVDSVISGKENEHERHSNQRSTE